ncbi:helix-turn-helix domain-containing protein [uncultured Methanospirillum sp.]|uniref:TrmB family transcriptional regulator n=1 Tax=uncultured Methanospirillum sp. TaxID=262503 RepID=UPI0029C64F42|nr:helix-turn-helix domain-containing protein [uncultured Methanospirillum sp.]
MEIVTQRLITALNNMGLPNLDAKVYAALVYLNSVGAKELIDFVEISKPSVYDSLQKLEERGLVVKNSYKPSIYTAVSPNLAIEIINREYDQAKEVALEELQHLIQSQKIKEENDAIWTVFGERNIRPKIREMIHSAEDYIICLMGERYIPLFEDLEIFAPLTLYIVSNDPDISSRVEEKLGKSNTSVTSIPISEIVKGMPHSTKKEQSPELMDISNLFEIIIDDKETLSIPPIRTNKLTGLHSSIDLMLYVAIDRMEMISGLAIHTPGKKKRK